jgi:Non-ribosomal peptide synthetase modules and related proteins
MLAIMRAGGCFLPLDPAYPDERLAHMLRDSGARLVIVDTASMQRIASIVGDDVALIAIDSLFDTPSMSTPAPDLPEASGRIAQAGSACLIYTSGSTGQPKGVLIGHAGLVNHNRFAREFYGITAADSQLQCSSMSFDLFLEEVLTVLTSGGKLVVASGKEALSLQRLATLVDEHGLTALNLPTAHFHEIASSGLHFASLRKVIVGGERLDPAKARGFLERNPLATLYNTYGPTETTIISTAAKVTLESLGERGRPPSERRSPIRESTSSMGTGNCSRSASRARSASPAWACPRVTLAGRR